MRLDPLLGWVALPAPHPERLQPIGSDVKVEAAINKVAREML